MNVDNKNRGASWERIAAEFKSERDALKNDVLRMQQERDEARDLLDAAKVSYDTLAEHLCALSTKFDELREEVVRLRAESPEPRTRYDEKRSPPRRE